MKVKSAMRILLPLLIAIFCSRGPVGAQNLVLTVTPSTNSIVVSNSLTYVITLTNLTALQIQNINITNAPSTQVLLLGATNANLQGTIITNSTAVIFNLAILAPFGSAQMNLTVRPITLGFLTNTVTAAFPSISTNLLITNVVVQVTAAQADLAVGIAGPAGTIFVNDVFDYGIAVTNRGPSTAQSVIFTNALPAGVGIISVSPTNPAYTLTNGILKFNLGTLTNHAFRTFSVRAQATNSGSLPFSVGVGSSFFNSYAYFFDDARKNLRPFGINSTFFALNG